MSVRHCAVVAVLAASAILTGCGTYSAVALTDPRLAEFADMHAVDRGALGLPPLPPTANVEVEWAARAGAPYDAMPHADSLPSACRPISV